MKHVKLILSLLTVALFAACSDNDGVETNQMEVEQPVSMIVKPSVHRTRVGYTNATLPDSFVIHILQSKGQKKYLYYDYKSFVMKKPGTLHASLWWPANVTNDTMLWRNHTPQDSVIAYTLNNDSVIVAGTDIYTADTVKISADQRDSVYLHKSDLLYYKGIGINPEPGGYLPIEFKHIMSKIKIKWQFATELDTPMVVDSLVINPYIKMPRHTVINYYDTIFNTPLATPMDSLFANVNNRDSIGEIIVLPKFGKNLELKFYVTEGDGVIHNKEQRRYTLYTQLPEIARSGVQYNFFVQIGRDRVILDPARDIVASPWSEYVWDSTNPDDDGNVETY